MSQAGVDFYGLPCCRLLAEDIVVFVVLGAVQQGIDCQIWGWVWVVWFHSSEGDVVGDCGDVVTKVSLLICYYANHTPGVHLAASAC